MKAISLFNPEQNFPIAALMNQSDLSSKFVIPVADPNHNRVIHLEAELNARMGIMDQTAMISITDLGGTIIYCNDLFCSVSGYSRNELIGNTHLLIRDPELCAETIDGIWKMIREGNSWQGILKSKTKAGENFWTKTTVAPVLNEANSPEKFVWVRHDITDMKKTELELYEAKQRTDQQLLDNLKNAHRIQNAILPSEKELQMLYPGAFLFSAPQQNVSGDFYWFTQKDEEIIFILGDGTGHGISGSFVSLIALSALEYIIKDKNEIDPGKILIELNDFIYKALNKHKASALTESVDMAICNYNKNTRTLRYASGKSKVYLVRKNEIYFLDKDEVSIGSVEDGACKINTRTISLQKGDRIFMMSDGFADQFGGEKNKRIGSKNVKELLVNSIYLPVEEQKEVIRKYFLHWKGENEQTDDLSLLAFQVD